MANTPAHHTPRNNPSIQRLRFLAQANATVKLSSVVAARKIGHSSVCAMIQSRIGFVPSTSERCHGHTGSVAPLRVAKAQTEKRLSFARPTVAGRWEAQRLTFGTNWLRWIARGATELTPEHDAETDSQECRNQPSERI